MNLRPASPQDDAVGAQLVAATMHESGVITLGFGDLERELRVLAECFRRPNNRFSYSMSTLAVHDDQPAGLLLAFPGRLVNRLSMTLAPALFKAYRLGELVKMIRLTMQMGMMDEARADEYYIAHLAVLPAFQKQGIGSALLEEAARQARTAGFNKCSLTVDIDNRTAQSLYLKTGFREVRRVHQPEFKERFGTAGYLRMVRDLTPATPPSPSEREKENKNV